MKLLILKIRSWTLGWAMLSYTLINSHSQVIVPGDEGPLVVPCINSGPYHSQLILRYTTHSIHFIIWASHWENLSLGFSIWWGSNQSTQLHILSRILKCIYIYIYIYFPEGIADVLIRLRQRWSAPLLFACNSQVFSPHYSYLNTWLELPICHLRKREKNTRNYEPGEPTIVDTAKKNKIQTCMFQWWLNNT